MNTEFKDIDKRYDLFWLGMKYEKTSGEDDEKLEMYSIMNNNKKSD